MFCLHFQRGNIRLLSHIYSNSIRSPPVYFLHSPSVPSPVPFAMQMPEIYKTTYNTCKTYHSLRNACPCPSVFLFLSFQEHFSHECKFLENLLANNYNVYESAAYPGMFVGLSKTGKAKRGNRVTQAMTMTHFLPRV